MSKYKYNAQELEELGFYDEAQDMRVADKLRRAEIARYELEDYLERKRIKKAKRPKKKKLAK